jgi:hypothetical protein
MKRMIIPTVTAFALFAGMSFAIAGPGSGGGEGHNGGGGGAHSRDGPGRTTASARRDGRTGRHEDAIRNRTDTRIGPQREPQQDGCGNYPCP